MNEKDLIHRMADAEDKSKSISVGGLACDMGWYKKPEPKQVIIIRKDLNMRKGKMIAQGAHASVSVLLDLLQKANWQPDELPEPVKDWLRGRFTKIVVYVNSEQELIDLHNKAQEAKIPCALIRDAGLTEFKEPTYTTVAIGPDEVEKIDALTKDLPLL